ncbi:MAG: hypothetical protein HZB55_23650 [Deltaproteobacteria bacterium]|nr:hypothetical protein [Deltaproteobacteria bacterium]
MPSPKGAAIPEATYQAEERRGFEIGAATRLRGRIRHFTESGVIGTKQFVAACYERFESHFACKHPKKPQPVDGVESMFSLKRLRKPA